MELLRKRKKEKPSTLKIYSGADQN